MSSCAARIYSSNEPSSATCTCGRGLRVVTIEQPGPKTGQLNPTVSALQLESTPMHGAAVQGPVLSVQVQLQSGKINQSAGNLTAGWLGTTG